MMKRLLSTALMAVLLSVIGGCQKPPEPNPVPTGTAAASDSHSQAEEAADNWTQTIKLDEGKKWKANPETTAGIQEMSNLVDTTKDPKILHTDLTAVLNELIQKCNMTGPAHDNLHVYLMPLMDKLEQLAKAESPEAANRVMDELKNHLAAYKNYFE
jgi:hypothetical protein